MKEKIRVGEQRGYKETAITPIVHGVEKCEKNASKKAEQPKQVPVRG